MARHAPQQLSLFGPAEDDETFEDLDPTLAETAESGAPESREPESGGPTASRDDSPEEDVVEPRRAESARELAQQLAKRLGKPVASVVLTRNRSRIVSSRPGSGGLEVRIHRCFADADERVLDAVAAFLALRGDPRRRRALGVIREHFREHGQDDIARVPALRPVGRVYDLRIFRDRMNQRYFRGALDVEITWGQAPAGLPARRRGGFHILLGSYQDAHRLVRVHPVLDREDVPEYVVESVVYHEMLHAAVPPIPARSGGRRRVHTREFRRRERLYYRHDDAEAWLDRHLSRLDRLRRQGRLQERWNQALESLGE